MGYVGNQTTNSYSSMDKQTITGNGGASYTLTHAVANAQEIEVYVNNVRQEPGVAYTVSGTALSMTGNVVSTDDFYVVYQGKAVGTIVPPDGSVTDAKISAMAASKLTGALPALDGSALTGVGSNVKEVLAMLCDGEDYTVSSGTYTPTNVTAAAGTSSTFSTLGGSALTYTPPSGTTAVLYEFIYQQSALNAQHAVLSARLMIAGTEVTDSRTDISANSNMSMLVSFKYLIPIGGTASAATGRQASWTSGKELKIECRRYGSSNEPRLHVGQYWEATNTGQFHRPSLIITAYG